MWRAWVSDGDVSPVSRFVHERACVHFWPVHESGAWFRAWIGACFGALPHNFLHAVTGHLVPPRTIYRNSVARALESLDAFRRPQSNHLLMSTCSPLSARDIAPGYSSNYNKFFSKEHNLKFSKKFEKIAYYLYQKEFNINAEFSQYYYIKILSED